MDNQDKLIGYSFKDGWVAVDDVPLARLLQDQDAEKAEEKTYFDYLFDLGYHEKPIIELGDPKGVGLEVYVNPHFAENKLPQYFIGYFMSDLDQMRYMVCGDYISLVELLAKLTPTIHLSLTTERLFKNV